MELPRGILEMIDDYVSEALDATGTRKPRRAARVQTPTPLPRTTEPIEVDIDVSDMAADEADVVAGEEPTNGLISVEVDDRTDPEVRNMFSFDEATAWQMPAFVAPTEPIPTLSRIRTARGSHPPPGETEIDDEVTNVIPIGPIRPPVTPDGSPR
jgi:hypothetical protein